MSRTVLWGPAESAADDQATGRTTVRLVAYSAPVENSSAQVEKKTSTSLKWLPYPSANSLSDGSVVRASASAPTKSYEDDLPDAPPVGDNSRDLKSDRREASDANQDFSGFRAVRPSPATVSQQNTPQQWRRAGSAAREPAATLPTPMPLPAPVALPAPSGMPAAPTLEQQLAARPEVIVEKCASPKDLKPIFKITDDIHPRSKNVPTECSLGAAQFRPRSWSCITYTWTAAATYNKPLYFEEEQLERSGHSWGPYVQPAVSAVHFFATVPLLPYMMAIYPPDEIQYSLGYYRPGNCAPYYLDPFPISVRGAVVEATVWTGIPFIF